jgi:hypothetical protein
LRRCPAATKGRAVLRHLVGRRHGIAPSRLVPDRATVGDHKDLLTPIRQRHYPPGVSVIPPDLRHARTAVEERQGVDTLPATPGLKHVGLVVVGAESAIGWHGRRLDGSASRPRRGSVGFSRYSVYEFCYSSPPAAASSGAWSLHGKEFLERDPLCPAIPRWGVKHSGLPSRRTAATAGGERRGLLVVG